MKRLLLPLLLALLSGCSLWPTPATEAGSPPYHQIRWSRELGLGSAGQHLNLQLATDTQSLYAAAWSGEVWSLDPHSGTPHWRQKLSEPLQSGPYRSGSLLLLGTTRGVTALNTAHGEPLWHRPLAGEVNAPITIANPNTFLVRTSNGYLYALDAQGNIRWSYQWPLPTFNLQGESAPVVIGDRIFIGTASGKVLALSLQQGLPLWELNYAESRGRNEIERLVDVDSVAAAQGMLLVSAYQYGTAALTLEDPKPLWSREEYTIRPMTVQGDTLLLADGSGNLFQIDSESGKTLWVQRQLAGRLLTAATWMGDQVVIGDNHGQLHWFKGADGRHEQSLTIGAVSERLLAPPEQSGYNTPFRGNRTLLATPLVVGTTLFALDQRGLLLAVE